MSSLRHCNVLALVTVLCTPSRLASTVSGEGCCGSELCGHTALLTAVWKAQPLTNAAGHFLISFAK